MLTRLVILVLFCCTSIIGQAQNNYDQYGALTRSDQSEKVIYLVFTGHDYFEGFDSVIDVLKQKQIKASFFLTGDFVRNHKDLVLNLKTDGHFVGAHSDKHLLYCDWNTRDSLLYSKETIRNDILQNLIELESLKINPKYFMPPFEWYNKDVVDIAKSLGQSIINFSPGTKSNADYTIPNMSNYIDSQTIINSIYQYEKKQGMNGFHLLIHPGTSPERTDKLWKRLDEIIERLLQNDYQFDRFGN